ncbi:nuclease-related domain-containing protein [Myxococcus sp. Y35]|uniref:nuclease-related domain-containing protein n=1 Tax=Pseudomyxococcus flavus TaxID=3115648 RepID=UPI003CEEC717
MPIDKKGVVYCVNHPRHPMTRNSGFSAITAVEATNVGVVFNASRGIPVVVFYCGECGYVESYAASKMPGWNEFIRDRSEETDVSRVFESEVFEALEVIGGRVGAQAVERNVSVHVGGVLREIDVVMYLEHAVYVFEVKSNNSAGVVGMGALQARDAARMLARFRDPRADKRIIYPVLVVPAGGKVTSLAKAEEVPVLKYNSMERRFENIELVFGGLIAAGG